MKENADRERKRERKRVRNQRFGFEGQRGGRAERQATDGQSNNKSRTLLGGLFLFFLPRQHSLRRRSTASLPTSTSRRLEKSLAVIRGRPSVRLSVPLSPVWSGSSKTPLSLGCYTWMDRIDRASGVELCLPRPAGQRPCVDRPGRRRRARGRQTGG